MPIQINLGLKGKEFPPYTVTVERGRIKDSFRAVKDWQDKAAYHYQTSF